MNKKEFIEKLEKQTGYDKEKCMVINSILEDSFIIGKKNKIKIVNKLKEKLNLTLDEAEKIYNSSMEVISSGIKNSIKHTFGEK